MNKKKLNKKTILRLLSYIKNGHKLEFIFDNICVIINSIVSVISSLFIKSLIDDYIKPLLLENIPDFSNLLYMLIIMAVVFLIGTIAAYISNRLTNKIAQQIITQIRDDLFSHMQTLPIKYYDNNSHGEIMSYYTNDIDAVEGLFSQSLMQLTSTIITIIAVFIAMIILSIEMTILVILTVLLMYIVLITIGKKSGKYFKQNQQSIAKLNGYIEEMMNGQKVIKVFNHENKIIEEFNKINEECYNNNYNANRYANIMMPVMGNLTHLQYVIIAIAGGYLAIKTNAGVTLGMIASFLQLSKSFSMPVTRLAQQFNNIIMAISGAERIFNLIDEESENDEGKVELVNVKEIDNNLIETNEKTNKWAFKVKEKDNYKLVELKGDVKFDNVVFGYTKEKEILHSISLYAKPGQKIAFVGATGAGKTTITNLINRFYEIQEGTITYDGINIKDIKKSSLRKSLGLVLQDTNLFTGTVLENLKYGNSDATIEEVINACKLVGADSFINRLPEGYNTMLTNNGTNLSGGQRQLLSIARCALLNPPVMILDEATSSIDTRTEKAVQDGMDKLMKNRTVFVIAHRLSTIKNSKAIMVLEKGNIIERGTHEELLKEKGTYYELYTGKFELE